MTPGSNHYNPDKYHELLKSKGLSFALSRDQSPDQSYLIPQIHTHPGVGAVKNSVFSMYSKNQSKIIRLTPFVQKP